MEVLKFAHHIFGIDILSQIYRVKKPPHPIDDRKNCGKQLNSRTHDTIQDPRSNLDQKDCYTDRYGYG